MKCSETEKPTCTGTFFSQKNDLGEYGNNGKGPVWWYPMDKMYDDANKPSEVELNDMKSRLILNWINSYNRI